MASQIMCHLSSPFFISVLFFKYVFLQICFPQILVIIKKSSTSSMFDFHALELYYEFLRKTLELVGKIISAFLLISSVCRPKREINLILLKNVLYSYELDTTEVVS